MHQTHKYNHLSLYCGRKTYRQINQVEEQQHSVGIPLIHSTRRGIELE